MKGAVALLKARGAGMFNDKDSVAVFRGVRSQMLTEAMLARKAVEAFPGPRGWLSDYAEDDYSPEALLTTYSLEITSILQRALPLLACDRTPKTSTAVSALLNDAISMQQRLQQWESDIPIEWYPRTAAISTKALPESGLEDVRLWPGPLHAYPSAEISKMRNVARGIQILCGDMANGARAWLNPEDYTADIEFQLTRNKVQALVNSICYSVPFHVRGFDLGDCVRHPAQDKISTSAAGQI